MKTPSYPIKAVDHKTTEDADEMVKLCSKGWLLINTTIGREVLEGGAFYDSIYYVLVKPAS